MGKNIIELAGIELLRGCAESATGQMPVERNQQPAGVLHGGASALLAETVGSWAAQEHAKTINKIAVGTELSISHLRAVRQGHIHAKAQAQHLGNSSAVYLITLRDDRKRTIASARLTCQLIAPATK